MIDIRNISDAQPNILYFQDESFERYGASNFLNCILKENIHKQIPNNISYISLHTGIYLLSEQLEHKTIKIEVEQLPTNTQVDKYLKKRLDYYTIQRIIDTLENVGTEYTIISKDMNTIVYRFEDIIGKFNATGLDILFSASKVNKPNIVIDIINNRDWRGDFRYFCCDCCIGKTDTLLQFFKRCKNFVNVQDVYTYEYIVRNIFQQCITNQDILVDFDFRCNIFQNFNKTMLKYKKKENKYIVC